MCTEAYRCLVLCFIAILRLEVCRFRDVFQQHFDLYLTTLQVVMVLIDLN